VGAPTAGGTGTPALIPVTGFDYSNRGEMIYYQRIFTALGAALLGLGLVFRGIENKLKVDVKKKK
jgi:hypothetical protein